MLFKQTEVPYTYRLLSRLFHFCRWSIRGAPSVSLPDVVLGYHLLQADPEMVQWIRISSLGYIGWLVVMESEYSSVWLSWFRRNKKHRWHVYGELIDRAVWMGIRYGTYLCTMSRGWSAARYGRSESCLVAITRYSAASTSVLQRTTSMSWS